MHARKKRRRGAFELRLGRALRFEGMDAGEALRIVETVALVAGLTEEQTDEVWNRVEWCARSIDFPRDFPERVADYVHDIDAPGVHRAVERLPDLREKLQAGGVPVPLFAMRPKACRVYFAVILAAMFGRPFSFACARYAVLLDVHRMDVQRVLVRLVACGMLTKTRQGRGIGRECAGTPSASVYERGPFFPLRDVPGIIIPWAQDWIAVFGRKSGA